MHNQSGLWSIICRLWIYVLGVVKLDHTVYLFLMWKTSCLFPQCLHQVSLLPTVNKVILLPNINQNITCFLILAIMQWNHKLILIFIAQFLIQWFVFLRHFLNYWSSIECIIDRYFSLSCCVPLHWTIVQKFCKFH